KVVAQEVWGRKGDRLAIRPQPQPDTPTVAEAPPIDPPADVTSVDAGGRITLASVDATAPVETPPTAAQEEIAQSADRPKEPDQAVDAAEQLVPGFVPREELDPA